MQGAAARATGSTELEARVVTSPLGRADLLRECCGKVLDDTVFPQQSKQEFECVVKASDSLRKLITIAVSNPSVSHAYTLDLEHVLQMPLESALPPKSVPGQECLQDHTSKMLQTIKEKSLSTLSLFADQCKCIFQKCTALDMRACDTAEVVAPAVQSWTRLANKLEQPPPPTQVISILEAAARANDIHDFIKQKTEDRKRLEVGDEAVKVLKDAVQNADSQALQTLCKFFNFEIVELSQQVTRCFSRVEAEVMQAKSALATASQNRHNNNPKVKQAKEILAKFHLPDDSKDKETAFLNMMKGKDPQFPQGAKSVVEAREALTVLGKYYTADAELKAEIETIVKSLQELLCAFAIIANLRTKVMGKKRKAGSCMLIGAAARATIISNRHICLLVLQRAPLS